jgi:hypothetical protein
MAARLFAYLLQRLDIRFKQPIALK